MKKILLTVLIICMALFIYAGTPSYKFKSGKFVTKTTGPFQSTAITYFDDYGKKIYVENSMEIRMYGEVRKQNNSMLILPDKSYMIQHDQKSYLKVPDDEEISIDEEFMNHKDDMGKKVGTEKILGRTCDIYVKDNMKFWIWKEMPLKYEITEEGETIVSEVISIEENAKIPASRFKLPEGYSSQAAPSLNRMNMDMEAMQKAMEAQEVQSSDAKVKATQETRTKRLEPVSADKFQKTKSAERLDKSRNKRLKPVSADRFEKKATETDKAAEAKKLAEEEKKKPAVEKEDTIKKIKKLKKLKNLFN